MSRESSRNVSSWVGRDSREIVGLLKPDEERALWDKFQFVKSWVAQYCARLRCSSVPRVRISPREPDYLPISHRVRIPAWALLEVPEAHLRIIVAHEVAHASRRWRSLLAWTLLARDREEILAEVLALRLTGASIDDLEAARRIVDDADGNGSEELDAYHSVRRKIILNMLSKK